MGKKKEELDNTPFGEQILPVDYCDEMSASFVDYSVSVITDRALPDVRDGLKPVQRRILWAMQAMGLRSNTPYKKSARIVGEVMGKYHPHGDSSSYGAMVHLAQDWVYSHPLVDGHGNFGSVEGDQEAAQRYTEARLSKVTEDMLLANLSKETVDFIPNYDGTEQEPTVLPAVLPNILISGTEGIAVGMASKMPTHNLGEVAEAAAALLDSPKLSDEELMTYLPGPDWATGGIVVNKSELPEIYKNGAGKIRVRGRVAIEPGAYGKTNLVVTEIPVTMIGAIDGFMNTVADLVRAKVLPDVTDISNLSGKEGIRIVIELKKGADAEQNLNLLYKKARLEDTFGYNAMVLNRGVPCQMSLKQILGEFLDFYRATLTRKYKALLEKEKKNAEIKEGLLLAADCIDTIIEVLRGSRDVATAKTCLMRGETDKIRFRTKAAEKQAKTFSFTQAQAEAILAMRLQSLIGLEIDALSAELEKCRKNMELYAGLLGSKARMTSRMKADMLELKKKYGVKRRTELRDEEAIVLKKAEIKEEKVYALLNRFGYLKLVDEATYERNKENVAKDFRFAVPLMNTGRLLAVAEDGQCHQIRLQAVPLSKYNEKGVPLETVSPLTTEVGAVALFSDLKPKEKAVLVSREGLVKRLPVGELFTARRSVLGMKLNDGDQLAFGDVGEGTLVMISAKGLCVSFDVASVPLTKRGSGGITGMKFNPGDKLETAVLSRDDFFTYNGKEYLAVLQSGKRASKGKPLC